MTRLINSTLSLLPRNVERPAYDRATVQSGIVHLGIGNFHRAHQAVYTDDVLNAGDLRWGIIGVSLRRPDIRNALSPQEGLYSLGVKNVENTIWRVVGAVQSVLYAPDSRSAVFEAIASPTTRIVSLTVTEKAYCLNAKGSLDEMHPDVLHDIANADQPRSVLGYLFAGLRLRHDRNLPLPAILSCDNLTSNGKTLRAALIRFAELSDAVFSIYLQDNLACPSTMVDRIVPETRDEDRNEASFALGLEDAWPVSTEPFSQWVIEDDFPLGRPEWDRFGVDIVADVAPYERMKLGLLNASHTALACLGTLTGYTTVADAMKDNALADFMTHFMCEDIAPVLALPPAMMPQTYIHALLARFRNPALHHKLLQIASDSSQKIQQRFMPTIMARLERGLPLAGFAYAIAAFLLLLEGRSEKGTELSFQDPQRDRLISLLRNAGDDDNAKLELLIKEESIFGTLKSYTSAIEELRFALAAIRRNGVQKSLQDREF